MKNIHPKIKALLGFPYDADDDRVRKEWNRRTKSVCKPCWELKYCPYGELVEQFPLPPMPRAEMVAHHEMLKGQLRDGIEDQERRHAVQDMVDGFDPNDYPEEVDNVEDEKACTVFGHFCPVFFVNEPLTETQYGGPLCQDSYWGMFKIESSPFR